MSSKRALRRKACDSKRSFASENDAWAALKAVVRNKPGGGFVTVYRCPVTHSHFHFGHPPARVRQSIRDRREARQ